MTSKIRRVRRWWGALLCAVWLGGCGYPAVSQETFELAKVLYTVCNLEEPAQLPRFRELLQQKHEAAAITADEVALLEEIVTLAEQGDWDRAEQEARQLLLDQNVE